MCDNMVDQYVPKGWDYVNRPVKCGNTLVTGDRAVCDTCANDPVIAERIRVQEENIAADNAWARSAGWGEF